jgi:hypothetical protein
MTIRVDRPLNEIKRLALNPPAVALPQLTTNVRTILTRLISILAIAIALSGCATSANFGSDAEANKTQVRLVSGTFDVVYRAAVQTVVMPGPSI